MTIKLRFSTQKLVDIVYFGSNLVGKSKVKLIYKKKTYIFLAVTSFISNSKIARYFWSAITGNHFKPFEDF